MEDNISREEFMKLRNHSHDDISREEIMKLRVYCEEKFVENVISMNSDESGINKYCREKMKIWSIVVGQLENLLINNRISITHNGKKL